MFALASWCIDTSLCSLRSHVSAPQLDKHLGIEQRLAEVRAENRLLYNTVQVRQLL